ncbi:hypothetical protein BLOT_002364 [Blomia tropicalis]|nr:hypothetical protein BLOT_002364 [Blomia tropicalis]
MGLLVKLAGVDGVHAAADTAAATALGNPPPPPPLLDSMAAVAAATITGFKNIGTSTGASSLLAELII